MRVIINRLIKRVYTSKNRAEWQTFTTADPLSDSGKEALFQSFRKASVPRDILLSGVTKDDKKSVSQILYPIQEKYAKLSVENKGKMIEEIYALILDDEKEK